MMNMSTLQKWHDELLSEILVVSIMNNVVTDWRWASFVLKYMGGTAIRMKINCCTPTMSGLKCSDQRELPTWLSYRFVRGVHNMCTGLGE